mmetsp:Transcript_14664/g.42327  ORF Transcript_14664/g.42327 Transcript_14664/m.42327 type:complete len:90 (+) Transcript_14664:467-736(+)
MLRTTVKTSDGTNALGLPLKAATPEGNESIPDPTMFFTKFTDDCETELNWGGASASCGLEDALTNGVLRPTVAARNATAEERLSRNLGC